MAAAIDARTTVGDRLFGWRFSNLLNADGVAYLLTAATLRMVNVADNSVKLAAGTVTPGVAGIATYAPAAIDVDTAGTYSLQITETAGGKTHRWPVGREWILEIEPVI